MTFDPDQIHRFMQEAIPHFAPAAQLTIQLDGQPVFSQAYGFLDPETRAQPVQRSTLFDLASLTKLFTAAAFMRLVKESRVRLDQPVSSLLPGFTGRRLVLPYEDPLKYGGWVDVIGQTGQGAAQVDAGQVTFRQLLRHTSGLPAWRPLKDQPDAASARQMALDTFFSYPPDTRIVYSDIGFILLGLSIEALTCASLAQAISTRVTGPLGLAQTRYLPSGTTLPLDVAPTEYCAWRNRRIVGEVHDENACRLGGISGHAGLFSTADEVAQFGQAFLLVNVEDPGDTSSAVLLKAQWINEMTRVQFEHLGERRGLGFALWSQDPEASSHPLHPTAFGHTGFTGTSLWIDPDRCLVVALLTNEVYNGRENRRINSLRRAVHQTVAAAVDASPNGKTAGGMR
jgi:CubicO group peptidase (beta-lactamase class C family)